MTNEQAQKVLDELQGVRPEKLNGEAKRLFEAIMKIADERDELKEELEMLKDIKEIAESKVGELSPIRIKRTNQLLSKQCHRLKEEVEQKDKVIDLMLSEITNNAINTCPLEDYNYDLDCKNKCKDDYKECWKQYFENKAKEK